MEGYKQGEQLVRHEIEAIQYPEILRIQDMLVDNLTFSDMSKDEIATYFPDKLNDVFTTI
jgi:hypothetical protein